MNINKYIQLARLNNWIKNLIIFSPLFFAGKIGEPHLFKLTGIATVSFSFITSFIYILNDYVDIDHDRVHPTKRKRPLASGSVPIMHAGIMAGGLLTLGLGIIYQISLQTFYFALVYVTIMIAYCLVFRKIALIDIGIIAIGFVLRLYIGSSITGVPNSSWIIIMTFLLALFIALAKRRDDLLMPSHIESDLRESLNGYNLQLVNSFITVLVPIIIVSYILYCTAGENLVRVGENLYMTSLFVLFGFMRYLQLIFKKNLGGDPIKLIFQDSGLQIIVLLWLGSFAWILYL
jgi:decaprenyl-phosphate phosphoribosyltransferase